MSEWEFLIERAVRIDGSLFFPERLTLEFLESQKRKLGSYVYSNQYLNEIIPEGDQTLKREWLRYYSQIPEKCYTFCFIDPAISQADTADFTGVVVVNCDQNQNWYLSFAQRFKINPTEIVNLIFKIQSQFNCNVIGIEDVAYQKALLYMLDEEMRRRNVIIPVTGIKPGTDKTKETRILGLVPRFEWGRILINQGLVDFELEYSQFPRGAHDDLIDALSQIERIAYYPERDRGNNENIGPQHPSYESEYIRKLIKRSSQEQY